MKNILKRVALLLCVLLCASSASAVFAQTIPAEGSIWTPTRQPEYILPVVVHSITVENAENGSAKASREYASSGMIITVTVSPAEGYRLQELLVTGKNGNPIRLTEVAEGVYTFQMPASSVTIRERFVDLGTPEYIEPEEVMDSEKIYVEDFKDVEEATEDISL